MKRPGLFVLAAWIVLSGSAQAGSIGVAFQSSGAVSVTAYYGGSDGSGGTGVGTQAGDFAITVLDPSGLPGVPTSFFSFCVDLQHWSQNPSNVTLNTMANWNLLAGAADYQRLGASYLFNQYSASARPTDGNVRAAYQVAIWELLYERNDSKRNSDFSQWVVAGGSAYFSTSSPTLVSDAQALITGIQSSNSTLYRHAGLLQTANSQDGSYAQDFMGPECPGCSVTVPDPLSSLGALAFGLLSLGGLGRWGLRR